MEIVNTLEIEDTNQRTEILERIGEIYGLLGRSRAIVENKRSELAIGEGRARLVRNSNCSGKPPRTIWHCVKAPVYAKITRQKF